MILYGCALALSIAYLVSYAIQCGRSHRGDAVAGVAFLIVLEFMMAAAVIVSKRF